MDQGRRGNSRLSRTDSASFVFEGVVHYVGFCAVDVPSEVNQFELAVSLLADPSRPSFVPETNYQAASLSVASSTLLIAEKEDHNIILAHVPLSEIFSFSASAKHDVHNSMFGFICVNHVGGFMTAGHICHILKLESQSSAERLVLQFAEVCMDFGGPRNRSSSSYSIASPMGLSSRRLSGDYPVFSTPLPPPEDSPSPSPPPSQTGDVPGGGSPHSTSLLTLPNNPLSKREQSSPKGTRLPPMAPSSSFSMGSHRRTRSDGAINAFMAPTPPVPTPPTLAAPYLLHQTAQNIYRRLKTLPLPLIKDFTVSNERLRGHMVRMSSGSQSSSPPVDSFDSGINDHQAAANVPPARTYQNCFQGNGLVSWLVQQGDVPSRNVGVSLLQHFLDQAIIEHVNVSGEPAKQLFEDGGELYRFVVDAPSSQPKHLSDSSISESVESSDNDSNSILEFSKAISTDDAELVASLLDKTPSAAVSRLPSLLYRAVASGSVNVARFLLKHKQANPQQVRGNGDTLLHIASSKGDALMVKLLLESGADVNASNSSNFTPLMVASTRINNLEIVILLLEHGAVIGSRDPTHSARGVDLMPDLDETQRRLCGSATSRLLDGGVRHGEGEVQRAVEALHAVRRLVANPENLRELLEKLKGPQTTPVLEWLCREHPSEAIPLVVAIVNALVGSRKSTRLVANLGMFPVLITLLRIKIQVRGVVLSALLDLAQIEDEENDFSQVMAKADLQPLIEVIGGESRDHTRTAARILSLISMYPPAQTSLNKMEAYEAVLVAVSSLCDLKAMPWTSEEQLVYDLVRALANCALQPSSHALLCSSGVERSLGPVLSVASRKVAQQIIRCFVYLGIQLPKSCSINIFDPPIPGSPGLSTAQDVIYTKRHVVPDVLTPVGSPLRGEEAVRSPSVWDEIKGASTEKIVQIITDPHLRLVCPHMFTAYALYLHPIVFLRMLLHKFHATPLAGPHAPLPEEHARLFELLKQWMVSSSAHFHDSVDLKRELRGFLTFLMAAGGHYPQEVQRMLDTSYLTAPPQRPASGPPPHDALYSACRESLLAGKISCTLPVAVSLAALQMHIEDLQRRKIYYVPAPSKEKESQLPPFKLSAFFPSQFLSVKSLAKLLSEEYFRVNGYSERDAKHLYLHKCQNAVMANTRFFLVKQYSDSQRKKKKLFIALTIDRLMLVEPKTHKVLSSYSLTDLQAWEISTLPQHFKVRSKYRNRMFLHLHFFSLPEALFFCGEEDSVLHDVATSLQASTDMLGSLRMRVATNPADLQRSLLSGTLHSTGPKPIPSSQPQVVAPPRAQSFSFRLIRPGHPPPGSKDSSPSASPHASKHSLGSSPFKGPIALNKPSPPQTPGGSLHRAPAWFSPDEAPSPSSRPQSPSSAPQSPLSLSSSDEEDVIKDDETSAILAQLPTICNCPPSPMISGLDLSLLSASALVLECPVELARQLTLLDHKTYAAVQGRDMLIRMRHSDQGESVKQFITHYNTISQWVAGVVVTEPERLTRARLIAGLLAVAEECRELNNLNGVVEITCALETTSVKRLTDTWELVPEASMRLFDELRRLSGTADNFHSYRSHLASLVPPAVPYLGLYLRDLTLAYIGNGEYVRGGLVNVFKWRRILSLLAEQESFQKVPYTLTPVPEILSFLEQLAPLDSESLYNLSLKWQPRKSSSRKSHPLFRLRSTNSLNSEKTV